jgi:Fe-S-cluster-containing dehydrogenase component/DMSO reductase anchor subunit
MKKGFIFNQSLCVNCKACSAACTLENNFPVNARNVLTYNREVSVSVPLSHLSIACNHCEIPVCLKGCPASAFRMDLLTEAVIFDESRCFGCNYCVWNCPYDAPKYIPEKGVIGKCHLCYSRLEEGLEPACTSGCPTGALSYGDISEYNPMNTAGWFPGNELSPAFRYKGNTKSIPLHIVPDALFINKIESAPEEKKIRGSDWSLILFSFFALLSVLALASSLINSELFDKRLFVLLLFLPGILSLLHLGKWYRAWRAVFNIKTSPLSREIVLYILYILISLAYLLLQIPWLLIAASSTGLLLLLAIDAVYIYSRKVPSVYLHSGQTFITALLLISFLSSSVWPFIFITGIKIVISIYFYKPYNRNVDILRHLRLALLLVAGASIISGISYPTLSVIIILLTGEFIDRILFYIDFEPTSINTLIYKHIAERKYETKDD